MIYFIIVMMLLFVGLLYRMFLLEEERDRLEHYWRMEYEQSDDLNEALMDAIKNAGYYPEEYGELKIVLKKIK